MMTLDPKGLEAAYSAGRDYVMEMDDRTKQMLRVSITAYLSTITPAEVGGLVERLEERATVMEHLSPDFTSVCRDAATALRLSAGGGVPDGWKLVPVEPTFEMQIAGRDAIIDASDDDNLDLSTDDADACYRAMLAASPTVEVGHVE